MRSPQLAWRDRSLPTSFTALQHCSASYSQFGEDVVLDNLMGKNHKPGMFVDVGCFHPIKWSNSYKFYLRGWRGVCVDPNDSFSSEWRKFRPADQFVKCAVSSTPGEATYIVDAAKPQENRILVREAPTYGYAGRVEVRRLADILDEYLPREVVIDFMSIDCEGHDLMVLQSNDFDRFRPRFLIVEHHYNREGEELTSSAKG